MANYRAFLEHLWWRTRLLQLAFFNHRRGKHYYENETWNIYIYIFFCHERKKEKNFLFHDFQIVRGRKIWRKKKNNNLIVKTDSSQVFLEKILSKFLKNIFHVLFHLKVMRYDEIRGRLLERNCGDTRRQISRYSRSRNCQKDMSNEVEGRIDGMMDLSWIFFEFSSRTKGYVSRKEKGEKWYSKTKEGYHIVNRISTGWKWREIAVEGYITEIENRWCYIDDSIVDANYCKRTTNKQNYLEWKINTVCDLSCSLCVLHI